MKILYCIRSLYNSGGMERVMINKANWFVAHGYQVIIVTTDQLDRPIFYPLDGRVKCVDLAVNYALNSRRPIWKKLWYFFYNRYLHKRRLRTLLQVECPDIIDSWIGNETTFLPRIKGDAALIAECHFCHYAFVERMRKGFYGWIDRQNMKLMKRALAHYDRFVVLTKKDREEWQMSNVAVIPNARTFEPDLLPDYAEKRVVAVGRLSAEKGYDALIDIWNIVAAQCPDWMLEIYGGGPDRDRLEQQIAEHSLQKSVRIQQPTSDIKSVYTKSSVLVLTSRYEGLPMVLLEAQASGLPVVSFDCQCGPRDIIENRQSGFLVPQGDVVTFAKCLICLMDSQELREKFGKQARIASENYSEEKVMQQWVDLFEQVAKK